MPKPHYNILIVDDSSDDRTTCKRYLQRDPDRNYTIWEEELSRKGLVASQVVKPDCILLDYRFPDIDGLQFLRQLRVLTGEQMPAVVMLTGSGREGIAIEAMKQGAQDYLVKDALTQESLWRAVGNAIESVRLRRALEAQRRVLQENEERLRVALQVGKLGAWQLDLTTGVLDISATCKANFGLPPDAEFSYQALFEAIHPEDRARIHALVEQAVADRTDYEAEYRITWPDGSVHWIVARGRGLYVGDGAPLHMVGVTLDITARKQAEEALRQQAEIIDQTHDAVIAADLDGLVTSWNKGAERLFGYTAEEMVGHSVLMLFPEELQAQFPSLVMAPLRERGRHELEMRQRRKSGEEYNAHLSLSLRRDQQGTAIGMIGYAIDITARKQAEEAVQRVNEELQQFAYIVSHDLNEPLRMISSYVQLLARNYQGKLDATADEFIAFAADGAQRLQQMIRDLLAYTQAGGQDLTLAPVDCAALLARVLSDLQIAIEESSATITHDPLPTVPGDATRLGQVLQNLIGNALKFRGETPPQVHVSAQRNGRHWRFSVRDNGVGIDPQQTRRLFQVFQRAHGKEYQGTGIGLAICKKIVERHGGRIWVESQPGDGATFYFTVADR